MKKLVELDAAVIVPGHGPAQRDKEYLRLVTALLDSVVSQAHESVKRGLSLEETRKALNLDPFRSRFAGNDPERSHAFEHYFVLPATERAWRQAKSQMLTESLPLAVLGGAAGLLVTPWMVTLLLRFQPSLMALQTPLSESVDYRVLAFTTLITTLAGILFGLIPALQSFRFDLIPALKEGASASGSYDQSVSLRQVLVVAQIALAVVVLVGAGLFVKSLSRLFAVEPGFETDKVLLARLNLNPRKIMPFDPEGDEQRVAREEGGFI